MGYIRPSIEHLRGCVEEVAGFLGGKMGWGRLGRGGAGTRIIGRQEPERPERAPEGGRERRGSAFRVAAGPSFLVSCVPMTGDSTPAEKLRSALDLFEAGVDLMRQNLRRSHLGASSDEVERRLQEWLLTRPGAEHGDCEGRLREPGEADR